jgi:hypothetical protein
VDLAALLREDLEAAERHDFDVVAITHLDRDHYCGFSEFFYLEHAKKYQSEDRIKIGKLWVPAAVICEEGCEEEEARIVQAEARHRLRNGEGVLVFSRPDALKGWLEAEGLSVEDRRGCFIDAGQLVPDLTAAEDGMEIFVHSPFADRLEDGSLVDRNAESIVIQASFSCPDSDELAKLILAADCPHDRMSDIVLNTKRHKNEERLEWDVFKLPHHCSYLSLGPDKGKDKTEPVAELKWLFEEQGRARSIVVSTSNPIPSEDTDQPPHRQAAKYYRDTLEEYDAQFIATMEHPSEEEPEPLEIEMGCDGAEVVKRTIYAANFITSRSSPRAG